MKRKAILYARVSTDEQADKGYSLRHQEETANKYCSFQNIEVVATYVEDHSAKTFERPEFKKLLALIKSRKLNADLLLFTKWDRFSRNAGDAYGMINTLNKLGVEPQAIEQPLDLSIPENKIMLAFYLAAPEVENDRRALNVLVGMRRAKKEGRYITKAPVGYKNVRDEFNNPIIVPAENAHIMRYAFEQLATGIHSIEAIRRVCNEKGLKCSRGNFWTMMRNPIYCGKIYVPAYKNEEACYVKATHQPIISEDMFYQAQDVLAGRKTRQTIKNTLKDELPLRGLLECRKCGGKLSGSASKGNGGRYFYYHCQKGCNERFKAIEANKIFENQLLILTPNKQVITLFKKTMEKYFVENGKDRTKEINHIKIEIEKHRERINNAQQLMLDGQLDAKDYKQIKDRYEGEINRLVRKNTQLADTTGEAKQFFDFGLSFLPNLYQHYISASTPIKQKIISSIFPEKLIFEKNQYRTNNINPAIPLIFNTSKGCIEIKTGNFQSNLKVSCEVPRTGIEPAHPCERQILSLLRLPIPPSGRFQV